MRKRRRSPDGVGGGCAAEYDHLGEVYRPGVEEK